MENGIDYKVFFEKFIDASRSLQVSNNVVQLIGIFRDFLREIIPHAHRVTVNVNILCGIANERDRRLLKIIEQLLLPDRPEDIDIHHTNDADVGQPLLVFLKEKGFPVSLYNAPIMSHYYRQHQLDDRDDDYEDHVYLGSVIVWQKIDRQPAIDVISESLRVLGPIINFMMSDIVARYHQGDPTRRAFLFGVSMLSQDIDMSIQECKVAILQLYGFTYDQTAERLGLSVNTVRKYLMSVYRKAGVHSLNELFAKYFTPARLRYT